MSNETKIQSIASIHASDGEDEEQREPDAEFIASAPTDVAALLAAVEAVLALANQWQENFPYKADRIRAAVTTALGGDK